MGEFSFPKLTLCADSDSVSVPPLWHVKGPDHFANTTPKHAYTLDPTKSAWADWAAGGHSAGTYLETSSHATCQGTFSHSHLSFLSHYGLILA